MGAVNTTYTFTATDTVTSGKLNNIIDQTIMTDDAVFTGGTVEVAGGKLKVRSGSITSNELSGDSVITNKILNGSVTSAKLDTNISIAGTLSVTGITTFSNTNGFTLGSASMPVPSGVAPLYAARAWGRFSSPSGTNTATAPVNGKNIGTITRTSTGRYTLTFPAGSIPQNPAIVLTSDRVSFSETLTNSSGFATSLTIRTVDTAAALQNFDFLSVVIMA